MDELKDSFKIIRGFGFGVVNNNNLFADDNQFAGSDELRANELQNMLDNDDIKAIMFARGGYGCVRIIDKIDFSKFIKNPKWLIGYSDITVFHSHISQNFGIQTMHASMPINFGTNTRDSLNSLFGILEGLSEQVIFERNILNRGEYVEGEIVGGNLSVLFSLLGSDSFPDMNGKILFLEDLDEYLYHIDRMMVGLKRAGKLKNLAGLLVGGMTQMNDNTVPFGMNAEEIIRNNVDEYSFPVFFGFPAGHIDDNMPLIIGRNACVTQDCQGSKIRLTYC